MESALLPLLPFVFAPPVMEGLLGEGREVAVLRPAVERIGQRQMFRDAFALIADGAAGGAGEFAARLIEQRMAEGEAVALHARFPDWLLNIFQIMPQLEQHIRD